MAHHASRSSVYRRLTDRLNRSPQGAPPSETLFEILRLLFSEREAELVSVLPLKPFTVARAAAAWKTTEAEAQRVLETLASRALLVDLEGKDGVRYVLPPPMAGFFEFSLLQALPERDARLQLIGPARTVA